MSGRPALSPKSFDRMTAARPARIIWTAEAIAQRIGVSADFIRNSLVHVEGSPVKKVAGRYCAHEGDLIAFFRAEPKEA